MTKEVCNTLFIILFAMINGFMSGHGLGLKLSNITRNVEAGRRRTTLMIVWTVVFFVHLLFIAVGACLLAREITNLIYG